MKSEIVKNAIKVSMPELENLLTEQAEAIAEAMASGGPYSVRAAVKLIPCKGALAFQWVTAHGKPVTIKGEGGEVSYGPELPMGGDK